MAMFCIKPSFEVCNQVTEKKIESVLHKYRQMSEREIGPNFSALVASVFFRSVRAKGRDKSKRSLR